ncbi:hypothetical protein ACTXT7_001000 [Hymenolepis weldensis]
MPHHTLQEHPKISLKNLAGKSCITHHILPIFSCTNRISTSFQELTESFDRTKAYFKRRVRGEAHFFFESKLAKFYEEGMRKLMARWEDAINKNGDYSEHQLFTNHCIFLMSFPYPLLDLLLFDSTSSEAQSVGMSILFTEYTSDSKRKAQIFSGVLCRPEYKDLESSKISPIFLQGLTIQATENELESQYWLIKNSSIYVQIGPDYFYGPSFFPKQTETNNPKITRKSFTGFDLSLAIQNSVIEVAIGHLIGNLGVIKLAYIFDVTVKEFLNIALIRKSFDSN